MTKCYIRDLEISDKKLFGDNAEYTCACHCFDGFAICYPYPEQAEGSDNKNFPALFFMTYPTLKEVHKEKIDFDILSYQMGDDAYGEKVTDYGDVCLYCGEVSRHPIGCVLPNDKIKYIDER